MLDVCLGAALGGHFGKVDLLVHDLHIDTALAGLGGGGRPGVGARSWPGGIWNIPTSRDMLNIVLGPTLGLDVAVVGFFGDYLDFPIGLLWGALFCNCCFRGGQFRDCIEFRLSGSPSGFCLSFYFGPSSARLVLDVIR